MGVVYGQDRWVSDWVAEQLGFPEGAPVCSSLGYELDGELVAGVTFDNMTDTNLFAHIASTANVLPRELLQAVAAYAFVQLGVQRMTFMVPDSNHRCVQFVRDLGARREGALKQGHGDGDTLIFALWHDARFVRRLLVQPEFL